MEPRAESPMVGQSLALPVFRMSSYVVLTPARCTAWLSPLQAVVTREAERQHDGQQGTNAHGKSRKAE